MTHTDGIKNVETVINRFGGMRPMARKINVPVSTIQGWKKRDYIPAERVDDVVKAAHDHRVSLSGVDIPDATNENTKSVKDTTEAPSVTPSSDSSASASPSPVAPAATRTRTTQTQTKPMNTKRPEHSDYMSVNQLKRDAVRRSVLTTLFILLLLGGIGFFLLGEDVKEINTMVKDQSQSDERISDMRTKFESFENTVTDGLNSLNKQVTDVASAVGVERNGDGEIILNNNMSLSERVTALESRLRASGEDIDVGQLVGRFENMTQTAQGQEETSAAMADLKSVVQSLQGRIGDLDAALQEAKQDNDQLAKSLENVTGRDLSAAAMLLAMTQMRDSLNRSEPFNEDLQVLQELVGEDDPELTAAINRLAPYAESGVLTPSGLSAELRGISGEIISAALRGEEVSVKEKVGARIGQILSIEKDGQPVMGIKEQAIVARAQDALDRGDVATAVNELNKLEGPAAQAAAPVTTQAMGRLNAQNTIDLLMQNLVTKMQNPSQMKGFIQSIPGEIKKQVNPNQPIMLTE